LVIKKNHCVNVFQRMCGAVLSINAPSDMKVANLSAKGCYRTVNRCTADPR